MIVSIKERLILASILPEASDIVSMVMKRDITKKIELTQDDINEAELVSDDNGIRWKNNIETEIKWSDSELKMLKDSVKKLDEEKKITTDNLDLALKIQGS